MLDAGAQAIEIDASTLTISIKPCGENNQSRVNKYRK